MELDLDIINKYMKSLFSQKRASEIVPCAPKEHTVKSAAFAKEVLDLEESIGVNCTLESITRLVNLYNKAIKYYTQRNEGLLQHYQNRLELLACRGEVQQVLSRPTTKPDISNQRSVERTIRFHEDETQKSFLQLQENLNKQNEDLYLRLQVRKNKHRIQKSNIEATIVNIVEECVENKLKARKHITKIYKEIIRDIEKQGSDHVIQAVIDKVKERMESDIKDAQDKLHSAMKIELSRVKQQLS